MTIEKIWSHVVDAAKMTGNVVLWTLICGYLTTLILLETNFFRKEVK